MQLQIELFRTNLLMIVVISSYFFVIINEKFLQFISSKKRLEGIAPSMRFKGRIQTGADADITIFNPNTVIDKSTFDKGLEFSGGIEYVMVNGIFVLKNGKTVQNTFAGQPVYGKYKK